MFFLGMWEVYLAFFLGVVLFIFEIFLETRPTFVCQPFRLLIQVQMYMLGEMMRKRGLSEYLARIFSDALELLASVDDHMFMMVPCPYAGLDWGGCTNILFTQDEPPDARGNISVFFKLI